MAGLARCYLKSGDVARAEQTIALVPPEKNAIPQVTSVRAAIDLARHAGSAGDIKALEAKIAANPADHQARIDLALAAAARGDKAERSINCSRYSAATRPGTSRRPASSWCSCSRRGGQKTRTCRGAPATVVAAVLLISLPQPPGRLSWRDGGPPAEPK